MCACTHVRTYAEIPTVSSWAGRRREKKQIMMRYSSLEAVQKAGHESMPEVDTVLRGTDLLGDVLSRILIYRSKTEDLKYNL